MMAQEITSRDIEITSRPSDMFLSSDVVETTGSEPKRSFWKNLMEMRILFDFPVSKIIQSENVSTEYQPPQFETKTALIDEFANKSKHGQLSLKISEIVDRLIDTDELFKGMDKDKLLETVLQMLNDVPVDRDDVSEDELIERIKRILALEAMSGILKELNPEQIETFDEAVKRRLLFK